jgi:chromosome segregation ATPase
MENPKKVNKKSLIQSNSSYKQISELDKKISNNEDEIKKETDAKIEQVTNRIATMESELSSAQTKLTNQNKATNDKLVWTETKTALQISGAKNALDSKINESNAMIDGIDLRLKDTESTIQSYAKNIENIEDLKTKFDNIQNELTNLKTQIQSLEQYKNNHEEAHKNLDGKIDLIEKSVDGKIAEVKNTLDADINKSNATINEINKELTTSKTLFGTLAETINKLSEEHRKFSEKIESLAKENAELKATIAKIPKNDLDAAKVEELISKALGEFKDAQNTENRSRSNSLGSAH